jgi:hypothetical protein
VPAEVIKKDVEDYPKVAGSPKPVLSTPWIIGCVQYTTPTRPGIVRQTPFSFVLDRIEPEHPEVQLRALLQHQVDTLSE